MTSQHGMSREEVDTVTNKGYRLPRNYWSQSYGDQMPVIQESGLVVAAPVTTTAIPMSTAPTAAPPADLPGGDAL